MYNGVDLFMMTEYNCLLISSFQVLLLFQNTHSLTHSLSASLEA